MTQIEPRSGYTLPVFATAAAIAAMRCLQQDRATEIKSVGIDLIEPAKTIEIPIEQVARLKPQMALAIAISDPGDNLDLTRNTPVWALVELRGRGGGGEGERGGGEEKIKILGGEGIGRIVAAENNAAIYSYAQRLLRENLARLLQPEETIQVTIILPEGRRLAERTSNAAFGIVEGLSLLGTTGISQPLSTPGQLDSCLEELRQKVRRGRGGEGERGGGGEGGRGREGEGDEGRQKSAKSILLEFSHSPTPPLPHSPTPSLPHSPTPPLPHSPTPPLPHSHTLVFCVGENGLDLTRKLGIDPDKILKTANWLGPLLVEAGMQRVGAILLFGYHGKLIKLAGGIYHTHHHLADGRLEIFTALAAKVGLPTCHLQNLLATSTTEEALKYIRQLDNSSSSNWVEKVYSAIAHTIDSRTQTYIRTHSEQDVLVGTVLFDRDRQIIIQSQTGAALLSGLC